MTKPVVGQTTFGASTSGTTTQLDNNFLLAYDALNDYATYSNPLTDTGGVNAYSASLGAGLVGVLADFLIVQIKIANTNTGASTFAYNGGSALPIVSPGNAALAAGVLVSGGIYQLQFSGGLNKWLLQTGATWSSTESNFNANVTFATPGNANFNFVTQVTNYNQLGKIVRLTVNLQASSYSIGTASGAILITGSPFTAAGGGAVGSCIFGGLNKSGYTQAALVINPGESNIRVQLSGMNQTVADASAADYTHPNFVLKGTLVFQST